MQGKSVRCCIEDRLKREMIQRYDDNLVKLRLYKGDVEYSSAAAHVIIYPVILLNF